MNRIDSTFMRLKDEGRAALITYITAGDPDMKISKEVTTAIASSGADIIELGIPFSDPLADGPTIQRAIQRSLSAGCTSHKVFKMVKEFRKDYQTPIVFIRISFLYYGYDCAANNNTVRKRRDILCLFIIRYAKTYTYRFIGNFSKPGHIFGKF